MSLGCALPGSWRHTCNTLSECPDTSRSVQYQGWMLRCRVCAASMLFGYFASVTRHLMSCMCSKHAFRLLFTIEALPGPTPIRTESGFGIEGLGFKGRGCRLIGTVSHSTTSTVQLRCNTRGSPPTFTETMNDRSRSLFSEKPTNGTVLLGFSVRKASMASLNACRQQSKHPCRLENTVD